VLPRAPQLWTSTPCQGVHQRYHISYGSGPHLPAEVGSGVATCPMAPDLTSWLWWAPSLLRVLWLRTLPPGQEGSRCCHISHGSQWAVGLRYMKKNLAGLPMQLGSCISKTRMRCLTSEPLWACKTCGQAVHLMPLRRVDMRL
jgi:hypothetical protein